MSYPKELWENTELMHKSYPIQLFRNKAENKQAGECVLFLHWHEHMEFIIVRHGEAVFHIDSQPISARQGDVLLVPGGSLHVGYAQSEGEVVYDCIVFNAALFNDWLHDPVHMQMVAPYLEGSSRFPVLITEEASGANMYQPVLDQITEELANKQVGYQLVVKSKLYALFVQLSRHYSITESAGRWTAFQFASRDRFKQLIEWIEQSFAEKLTVQQAAHLARLDPFHFCKQFKRLTGRTFIEYVNVCRTNEAERLLLTTEATVSEIAIQVGCENANYFTRLYKQYKGLTPSAVRRRESGTHFPTSNT